MKRITFAIVFILALFVFVGCGSKGKLTGVKSIKKQEIFNQKEDRYYVYFHRLDCPDCDASAPAIINYMDILREYPGCEAKRPIYTVLLFTESEKPGEATYIFRQYDGEDGDGTNETFKVKGVLEWQDLYIGSTSSLISISTKDGVRSAKFEAQGAEDITAILEEQLGDCYKK